LRLSVILLKGITDPRGLYYKTLQTRNEQTQLKATVFVRVTDDRKDICSLSVNYQCVMYL